MSDVEKQKGVVPATHSVTVNKRPPTEIEVFRKNLEGEFLSTVQNYYRGNEQEALMFKTAAVDYVRKVPKLLECNRISLLSALVQAAQFRFMPSGVNGECYIIPYGTEAKFQIGYQGIVTLLYRTDKVSTITANLVYEGEDFEYQEGLNAHLVHKPTLASKKGKKLLAVYTVATMTDGSKTFKVMTEEDVMEIKNLSKAKSSKESPWNSDKDPFFWMWKKTCLIQHAKLLPKTRELQTAIEKDFEGEGSDRHTFDAAGPAVGRALHTPEGDEPTVSID